MPELLNSSFPFEFIIVRKRLRTSYFMKTLLNGGSCHRCYFLLNGTMDLHMPSLGTLVPQGPCASFMEQGINLLRSNTWLHFFPVLWFDVTHIKTKTHGTHWGLWTDTRIQVYINATCYVLTAALCIKLNE